MSEVVAISLRFHGAKEQLRAAVEEIWTGHAHSFVIRQKADFFHIALGTYTPTENGNSQLKAILDLLIHISKDGCVKFYQDTEVVCKQLPEVISASRVTNDLSASTGNEPYCAVVAQEDDRMLEVPEVFNHDYEDIL